MYSCRQTLVVKRLSAILKRVFYASVRKVCVRVKVCLSWGVGRRVWYTSDATQEGTSVRAHHSNWVKGQDVKNSKYTRSATNVSLLLPVTTASVP